MPATESARFDVIDLMAVHETRHATAHNVPARDVRALVETWVRPSECVNVIEETDLRQWLADLDGLRTSGLNEAVRDSAAALGVRIEPAAA